MALLSDLPLSELAWVEPPRGKPWLRARVAVQGGTLHAVVLHVDAWAAFAGRWAPARENLEAVLAECDGARPAVLLGDFNLTGNARDLDTLRSAGLVNAFEAVGEGFGFTFPVFGRWRGVPSPPVVRIDHVWVTPDVEVLRCEVGPDGGSDHLPLRARLSLAGD
jgi:endonuclease/exonuclease/phosphatase family metal-dependent hydrolase